MAGRSVISEAHKVSAGKQTFADALGAIKAKDYPRAVELLTVMANKTPPHAMSEFLLAFLHQNGRGMAKNVNLAIELYAAAYEHGERKAALPLAKIYEARKNLDGAKEYYEKALDYLAHLPVAEFNEARAKEKADANAGLARTEKAIAAKAEQSKKQVVSTDRQGEDDLFNGIDPGTAEVQFEPLTYLGECYEFGGESGYSKELTRAVVWYCKAKDKCVERADRLLARVLKKVTDNGLPKLPKTRQFLVEANGPLAFIYEGLYNEFGLAGTEKNLDAAKAYYHQAAMFQYPFTVDPLLKRIFAEIAVEAEEHLGRVKSAIATRATLEAEAKYKQAEVEASVERERMREALMAKFGLVRVLHMRASMLAKEQHDCDLKKLADELKVLRQVQTVVATEDVGTAEETTVVEPPAIDTPVAQEVVADQSKEDDEDIDFVL